MPRKNEESTVWGPDDIGPVRLSPPADEKIRDIIISAAKKHPQWGPLRVYEELRVDGANLTEENVHWVLWKYKLRNYA